jgi:hypothetical protein
MYQSRLEGAHFFFRFLSAVLRGRLNNEKLNACLLGDGDKAS